MPQPEPRPATETTLRRPVTVRAVLIALCAALVLAAITPKNDQRLLNTFIAGFHFPLGAFVLLLFLAIPVNRLLRWTRIARPLTRSELISIWCICLVTSGIPSSGLMRLLVPVPAGFSYYATPQNEWESLFADKLPDWMIVRDEQAAQWFFEGLPQGQGIPWRAWMPSAIGYGIFTLLFYTLMVSLATVIRRQWVNRERFTFPLVELPIEVANASCTRRGVPAYFRNGWFLTGAGLAFIIFLLDGLNHYHPSAPDVPITNWPLGNWFTEPPLSAIGWFRIKALPMMTGLAYLASTEITFSVWFFYLLRGLKVIAQYRFQIPVEEVGFGWGPGWELFEEVGAYTGFLLWTVWVAREHLSAVFKSAFGRGRRGEDADEPTSYRFAVLTGATAFALAVAWLCLAGLRWHLAILEVGVLCGVIVVMSWLVTNGGVMMVQNRFSPSDLVTGIMGTDALTRRELVVMPLWETIYARDLREIVLPSLLNAHRATDPVRLSRRRLTAAMVGAMLLVTVVSYVMAVRVGYDWSAGVLPDTWAYNYSSQRCYEWPALVAKTPLTYGEPLLLRPNLRSFANGFTVAFGLLVARTHWLRLPLHPAGLVLAGTYAADETWSAVFVGWLAKSLLQRFGGLRALRSARPFFMGLIVGHVLIAVVWIVVGWYVQDTDRPFYVLPP